MMFSAKSIRLIAIFALCVIGFTQTVTAAMGCAAMRLDQGHAVMPSGEPCDMLPGIPGALCMKLCVPGEGQTAQSFPSLSADAPALPLPAVEAMLVQISATSFAHARATQRILGPPPLLVTQRFLI